MRLFRTLCVTLMIVLLPLWAEAQGYVRFCSDSREELPADLLIDVTLNGRGMIWPTLRSRVFFRLYKDGTVEYDSHSRQKVVRKKYKLKQQKVADLIRLGEDSDFLNAKETYPLLEDLIDAVLKTCVTYNGGGTYKRILIINYMPDHPSARGFYPSPMMEMLKMISEIRPKTKFERKYGDGKAGLPYHGGV